MADRDRSRQRRHRQTSRRALAGSVYLATICAPQHKHPIRGIHTAPMSRPVLPVLFGPRSTFCAVGKSSALRTHVKFEIRSLTIRIYEPPGLRWIADRNTVPRQNFAGGHVGELSALIRRQSQLDDHPTAPPASPLPVPLRRPPPARPGKPRLAPAARRVQENDDPAETTHG